MGVYEDDGVLEQNMMDINMGANAEYNKPWKLMILAQKNKAANAEYNKPVKLMTPAQKNKAERLLIAALILVIIGLISALIIVCTSNNEIRNQKSAPCDVDWIWYRGKCYYFSTEPDTWNNSEKFCNSHNSSLAIIENEEELDFLFRYRGTDNHWIGIRRTDDNTAWTWTNGTLYNESLFKIRRSSPENVEYAYLNSKNVGSDGGNFDFKWICKN